jgi:uncharacterized membrane protein
VSLPQDKIADFRLKQLEMVQANIARMAGYGSTIKNWCITVTTAVCGFSFTIHKPGLVWLALLPVLTFALIDAQYLRVERQFRQTFDRLRREDWDTPPSFDVSPDTASHISLTAILCSWSILSFYLPLAIGVAIVMLFEWSAAPK